MKARDILPASVIGTIVSVVLLLVVDGYAAVSAKGNLEAMLAPLLAMALLSFAVGGFVSAYIAARKAKDVLDCALASSSLAAVLSTATVGALWFLSAVTAVNIPISVLLASLLMALILLFIVGDSAAVLGGLALAAMRGCGKSVALASLKRGWSAFKKSPRELLVPLLLTIVLFAAMVAVKEIKDSTIAMGMLIVLMLLAAFVISAVIIEMRKKHSVEALFKQSIISSKEVFIAMVAVAIPPTAIAAALLYAMLAAPQLDALWALVLVLAAISAIVYFFVFALVPQSMVLSKKRAKQAFADSYKKVKAHWLAFVGLLSLVLLIDAVAELALLGVDLAVSAAGWDSSLLTSWLLMAIGMIVSTAALTGFYMEAKK